MSTRPATPPPVKRWPYFVGDALLLAVAFGALLAGGTPPTVGTIIVVTACVMVAVGLFLTPYLLEYDARVRIAEAGVSEHLDAQARRLTQCAEQLSHAVSRSQSTEEQAGQILGNLEDLSERLANQSEELAQSLARASEREVAELKAEIDRLARDRDQQFATLNDNVASVATTIHEAHSATKLSISAHAKAIDDVHVRLDAIGTRLDEVGKLINHLRATLPSMSDAGETKGKPPAPATPRKERHPAPKSAIEDPPPAKHNAAHGQPTVEPASETPPSPPEPEPAASTSAEAPTPVPEPETPATGAKPDATEPAPASASVSTPAPTAPKRHPKPADMTAELPLEGMPPPRQPMKLSRRELAGATSLVATAYIGIGNKLYLRGEGPGLSWERGVPMQFLAIGKWGWTTTDAANPVVCRIFRNDEAPMLDADVILTPGEKLEITPRF